MSENRKTMPLSQPDQAKLRQLFVALQSSNSSTKLDATALALLQRMATQWHARALFPSLYLLRLLLMRDQLREATQMKAVVQFLTTGLPPACKRSDASMTQVSHDLMFFFQ